MPPSRPSPLALVLLAGAFALVPATLRAQGAIEGRVVGGAEGRPVADAAVDVPALGLAARTDAEGRYRLAIVAAGEQLVVVRAPGFRPDSGRVAVADGATVRRDVALRRVVQLDEVRVAGARPISPTMRGFEERRALGHGHFVTRDDLEKDAHRQTAEIVAKRAPGVRLRRASSKAWATNGRTTSSGACAMCKEVQQLDRADAALGAKRACYMDVYLDGALVYNSAQREGAPLWDLNGMRPGQIEGIEVYTGLASIPPQYNRTSGGCGVILIWTRVSP